MAHIHSVIDMDKHFVIDPVTRIITNATPEKKTIMQYDHNSERFTFEIPRYIDGHDMSLCDSVQIHYIDISPDKRSQKVGVYEVDDLHLISGEERDDIVLCSWLISQNATQIYGSLNFLVRYTCTTEDTVEYAWNTAIFSGITVSNGIYNGPAVVEEYADILEQWRQQLFSGGGGSGSGTPGKDGEDGGYYTPAVSNAGDLSWTPSKTGMPAIPAVNIKGPKGDPGDGGTTPRFSIGAVTTLNAGENATASITGTTENPVLNLGIPKGPTGSGADISVSTDDLDTMLGEVFA